MNDDIFKADNGNATFNVPDGKTLNMLGNRFTRPDRGSGNGLTFAAGVTAAVKNGIISNDSDMTMVDIGEGATVTFENITFEGFGGTRSGYAQRPARRQRLFSKTVSLKMRLFK